MTQTSKYYVGDVGTVITVDVGSDISTATYVALMVEKPTSHKEVTWVGTVYNSNYIQYTTKTGDFNEVGTYKLQAHVEMPFWQGRGNTALFIVSARYT